MTTRPDASPLTDDLDDLTLHEPVTKENDMNEARASERADLVEQKLQAMIAATYSHIDGRDLLHELRPNSAHHIDIVVRINGEDRRYQGDWLKALTWARDGHNHAELHSLRAELSRASATAQEPADTKAVMDEFEKLLSELVIAVADNCNDEYGQRNRFDDAQAERDPLRQFVQHLASRASPSQPETPEAYNDYLEKCLEEFTDACIRGDASEVGEATDAIREFLSIDIGAITKGIAPSQPAEPDFWVCRGRPEHSSTWDSWRHCSKEQAEAYKQNSVVNGWHYEVRGLYTHAGPQPAKRADLAELRIGSYGAAYDGPDVCRAYTYKHQPGNSVAYRLGAVTVGCRTVAGGDHIDYGLSLLKLLEDAGFGVFDLRAELSRASAKASASKLCTKCHGLKTYCTHCNELGLEPAATASRVVSDDASLGDWFAKHVIEADTSSEKSGFRVEEVVRYRDLRKLLDRLIPAPSVAEPAKCGTCGYAETVDGSFMHGDERQEKRMACPDCTPASAEQASTEYTADEQFRARQIYDKWTANQGIHCNRFPAFHELHQQDREKWYAEARACHGAKP